MEVFFSIYLIINGAKNIVRYTEETHVLRTGLWELCCMKVRYIEVPLNAKISENGLHNRTRPRYGQCYHFT